MLTPHSDTVPVFKLYGETRHWPTPDLLHCESIAERSRRHDWHIRAHRHADLLHILHIESGELTLEIEGNPQPIAGPALIVIPAMTIHGFRFSQTIQGHIVTLAKPLVETLSQRLGPAAMGLGKPAFHELTREGDARRVAQLIAQLQDEYRYPAPGRDLLLNALLEALAIHLIRRTDTRRKVSTQAINPTDRGQAHLNNLLSLVEAQYREQPSVESLAAQLGLTSAHLNTLCRRLASRSALQILHERLLLEAKRELTYTSMTISQIADTLGFSEPAYFTRFFKRHTMLTPKAFRQRHLERRATGRQ